jgi:hypothetical protein
LNIDAIKQLVKNWYLARTLAEEAAEKNKRTREPDGTENISIEKQVEGWLSQILKVLPILYLSNNG